MAEPKDYPGFEFEDALSIIEYAKRSSKPENTPQTLSKYYYGGSDARLQKERELEIAALDPELDNLMGFGSYAPPPGPIMRRQANQTTLLERVFFKNRNDVAMEWLLENYEDIPILADIPGATQRLYDTNKLYGAFQEAQKFEEQRKNEIYDTFVKNLDVSRAEAAQIYEESGVGVAIAEDAAANATPEQMLEAAQGLTKGGVGADLSQLPADARAIWEEKARATIYENTLKAWINKNYGETLDGQQLYEALSGDREGLYGAALRGMDMMATGLGFFASGVDWLFNNTNSAIEDSLTQFTDALATLPYYEKQSDVLRHALEEEAGLPREDLARRFLTQGLLAGWAQMEIEEPDETAVYLAMAAGNVPLAQAMWAEDAQYMGFAVDGKQDMTAREMADVAAEEYQKKIKYDLEALEDGDFSTSGAFLDFISIYGEFVNDIATTATMGGKALWEGDWGEVWSLSQGDTLDNYFKTIRSYGSPSGVFGMDGTLTGLALDLGINTIVDPMTWVFGPKLAKGGGVVTPKLARQAVESAPAAIFRRTALDGVRSSSRGAMFTAAITEGLQSTGLYGKWLSLAKGFKNAELGNWKLFRKWGAVSDDVHVPTLVKIMEDGQQVLQIEDKVLDAALAKMRGGDYEPVVISFNPRTGQRGVTSGAEYVAAANREGISNIKVTLKADDDFGLVRDPDINRALNVSPEGTMAAEDLAQFRQFDYTAENALGGNKDQVLRMEDTINQHGADAFALANDPVQITYYQGDGTVSLVDGNHRITALNSSGNGRQHVAVEITVEPGNRPNYINNLADAPGGQKPHVLPENVPHPDLPSEQWLHAGQLNKAQEIDGTRYVNPRHAMPEEVRWGDVIDIEAIKEVEYQHIMMGGRPLHGQRLAVSTGIGHSFREVLQKTKIGSSIDQFFTPVNNSNILMHTGAGAQGNATQVLARVFGSVDDMDGLEWALARVNNWHMERSAQYVRAEALRQEAALIYQKLKGIEQVTGGRFGDIASQVADPTLFDDVVGGPQTIVGQQNLRAEIRALERRLDEIRADQDHVARQFNDYSGLNQIYEEIFDDFNRAHLATKKVWQQYVDPDTGLVDVTKIPGRSTRPQEALEAVLRDAEERSVSLLEAYKRTSAYQNPGVELALKELDKVSEGNARPLLERLHANQGVTAYQMPLSPLEMMAAANGTPDIMRAIAHRWRQQAAREWLHNVHTLWMIDKVLTPRTGLVVSMDELMRIWHLGGAASGLTYMGDKVRGLAARTGRLIAKDEYLLLPKKWQQRMAALQEIPDFFQNVERSLLESHGYGLKTIEFKKGRRHANTEYYAAAQRQAQQTMRDPGWQAFFKGEDAFKEWFLTDPDAATLRNSGYYNGATFTQQLNPMWKEVYNGYQSLFDTHVINIPDGKKARAFKYYAEGADRAANSSIPVALPDWVLEGFQEVSGAARVPKNTPMKGVDWLSQQMFQGPMNYRQGFLAEMVRKTERARLKKLYNAQNVKVIPDQELIAMLRKEYPDIAVEYLEGLLPQVADDLFRRANVVTQRYVDDLVEQAVVQEMESALYAWHRSSPAGRVTRGVFPFGRPWADMWGFWGREMLGRPQLRGYINEANFLNIGPIANSLVDSLPFNPKTAGFVSRIAATDFDLENIEDDPIFGAVADTLGMDSIDVGNALFLPHGGRSPFLSLLPGFGVIPTLALEAVVRSRAPDPIKEPQAYQQYMDQMEQFLPGVGYNRPVSVEQFFADAAFGGGAIARMADFVDFQTLARGLDLGMNADAITGDYRTAVAVNRQVRVMLADEKIWEELFQLPPEYADIGMQALINEKFAEFSQDAAQKVGAERLTEHSIETLIPSNVDILSQPEGLQDIWFTLLDYNVFSDQFIMRLDLTTDEGKREAAERIGDAWWDLGTDLRDNLIAEHPALAVNTVSGWEWTDAGKRSEVAGTGLPYRSGGSAAARATHANLVQLGYIRPLTQREMLVRIIGTVHSTRARVAKQVYEDAAARVNDARWDLVVPEDWKEWVQPIIDQLRNHPDGPQIPWTEPREIWENWEKVRDIVWDLNGRPMKRKYKDPERPDMVPDKLVLPSGDTGFEPWARALPSEFSELRDEYEKGFKVWDIPEDVYAAAKAIGIELYDGIPMNEIYQQVANYRAENYFDNPVYVALSAEYSAYLRPRSAAAEEVSKIFGIALDHSDVSEEARFNHRRALLFVEEAVNLKREGDPTWIEAREVAHRMYSTLFQDDMMRQLGLDTLWNNAWGRELGEFVWEPPEPAPLYEEGGNLSRHATQILPQEVYDGDTIQFSTSPTARLFGSLGGPTLAPEIHSVRLLGVNAREVGEAGGIEDKELLKDAIETAIQNRVPIYLVRQPDVYGSTDLYGRQLSWLYIGDEPWVRPETQIPGS